MVVHIIQTWISWLLKQHETTMVTMVTSAVHCRAAFPALQANDQLVTDGEVSMREPGGLCSAKRERCKRIATL